MARRPYFNFYPADWRGNTKLKFASQIERSVWLDFMCIAHDSDEYGILRMDLKRVADAIPCHSGILQSLADQGILKGCHKGEHFAGFFHEDKNGVTHELIASCPGPVWFSSRMVLDEHLRRIASEAGKKGGGSPAFKGRSKPRLYTSSSSSSSSSGVPEEKPPYPPWGGGSGFPDIPPSLQTAEFIATWAEWAAHRREIRHKLTPRAAKQQLADCEQWGVVRSIAAIRNSISGSYQKLCEPYGAKGINGKPKRTHVDRGEFAEDLKL